jgi:hypothetical protein
MPNPNKPKQGNKPKPLSKLLFRYLPTALTQEELGNFINERGFETDKHYTLLFFSAGKIRLKSRNSLPTTML